jgi:predicted  nucleic acid-binding Zn-ribbon protein
MTKFSPVCREKLQQEVRRLEGELATTPATSAAAADLREELQKEIVECKDELVAMQQDLTEWPHAW